MENLLNEFEKAYIRIHGEPTPGTIGYLRMKWTKDVVEKIINESKIKTK